MQSTPNIMLKNQQINGTHKQNSRHLHRAISQSNYKFQTCILYRLLVDTETAIWKPKKKISWIKKPDQKETRVIKTNQKKANSTLFQPSNIYYNFSDGRKSLNLSGFIASPRKIRKNTSFLTNESQQQKCVRFRWKKFLVDR